MTEYNKENPFPAKITQRYLLNKGGSSKKTYHVTLDLTGSNISYLPGDALAVFPENPMEEVDALVQALKKSGNETVVDPRSGSEMSLSHFIKTKVNLIRIPTALLKQVAPSEFSEKQARLKFIGAHDLIDFFETYPTSLSLQELVSYFAPLLPRFYSIASSPSISPNAVDLLVATFTYTHGKKKREGLGSHYLCNGACVNTSSIYTYLHPTSHFLLPKDPTIPIIMIGPGTGVAPYRAFLQEREAQKASGKNWLFFGERNQATDYYYADYLESLKEKGFLSLDLAFSRDQSEKCYVQHRLLERGKDIWSLLSSGAHLYVCGDARCMAKDVTTALSEIIETEGGKDPKPYLKMLRKEKRLLLDVY